MKRLTRDPEALENDDYIQMTLSTLSKNLPTVCTSVESYPYVVSLRVKQYDLTVQSLSCLTFPEPKPESYLLNLHPMAGSTSPSS